MTKDIKDRELKIGDEIAYAAGGKRGGLRVGTIYEFPVVPHQERYNAGVTMVTRIRVQLDTGRRTMLPLNEKVVRLG